MYRSANISSSEGVFFSSRLGINTNSGSNECPLNVTSTLGDWLSKVKFTVSLSLNKVFSAIAEKLINDKIKKLLNLIAFDMFCFIMIILSDCWNNEIVNIINNVGLVYLVLAT